MSDKSQSMSYPRALSPAFLALLVPDGLLHPLVRFVLESPKEQGLDIHLRGDRVTLYLGLTKVFDLGFSRRKVRLTIYGGESAGYFTAAKADADPRWHDLQSAAATKTANGLPQRHARTAGCPASRGARLCSRTTGPFVFRQPRRVMIAVPILAPGTDLP